MAPISYWSPKGIALKDRVPFITLVMIVMGFSFVLVDPPKVLLGIAVCYALSGPIQWLFFRSRSTETQAHRD